MGVARRYSPIGIDFGAREVRAVQLVRDHAGVRLHRAACPPSPLSQPRREGGADATAPAEHTHPSDEGLADAWASLQRRGFRGRRVALAAPGGSTKSSVVECPRPDAVGMVNEIVRVELTRAHALEPGSFETAWWELPRRASKGGAVLACACGHEITRGIDERCCALGLDVVAIDVRSLALARACAPLLDGGERVLDAIVEIGWDCSRVLVVGGGVLLYERELPECTLERAQDQIAAELMTDAQTARGAIFKVGAATEGTASGVLAPSVRAGVARLAEPIVGELGVSISYAVRNYGLEATGNIALVGDGAVIPGLPALIGEGAGMRTLVWEAPAGGCGGRPAMAAAWGLAARFDRGTA